MLQRVVFLDRDGVINRDSPDYIKCVAEFEVLPGSLEALRCLAGCGFSSIVVTNQSGLHRGLFSPETLAEIHRHMCAAVQAHGGLIRDILVCPHLPGENCPCRKPRPGLLTAARRRHRIDLATAVMVGDSVKDIECARNAGVQRAVLVRTGNGGEAERALCARNLRPDFVADDLREAARWITQCGCAAPGGLPAP
jgi:D-glycero-D-manno-heptose 1,7-bisphosphate phosphatase